MARVGTLRKQPGETLPFTLSFDDVLDGAVPASITPVVSMPAGLTKTAQVLDGNVLQVWVAGGSDGDVLTVTVVTSIIIAGNLTVVEDEVLVRVREVS